MSRPVDWTPLAAGDPIPGDPEVVERAGHDYRLIAKAIETAARRLRTIATDMSMQSDAVAQIRERADHLSQQVGRAHDRYEAIGSALIGYAHVLTEAQASSLKAFRLAQEANANLVLARWGINDAQRRIVWQPEAAADLATAQRREQAATAELADARAILDRAVHYRDEAAEAARRVIDAAKHHDGLNDSTWDNIKAATISVLESAAKIVDMIAIGAGVLALLFAAVPFVGEFFAAVALVASIVSLALKLALMAFGEGSWLEIGLAAVGVATFGIGKVAIGSSEFAAAGARTSARLAAGRLAAGAPEARAALGLPASASTSRVLEELMGAENLSRAGVNSLAQQTAQRGPAGAMSRGLSTIRDIPANVAADLKGIRNFDISSPIAQFKSESSLRPLSLMGERGAAAEDRVLGQMHEMLTDDRLVARRLLARDFAVGGFVTTWATGSGLLARDTWLLTHKDPEPTAIFP